MNLSTRKTIFWPLLAPFKAVPRLTNIGGIDLAASLAFFTVLSLLPLVALMAMLLIAIGPADGVVDVLTEPLYYLFPASLDLINEAINNLLGGSLTIGILATINLIIGANGLFAATSRAINRVFGVRNTRAIRITIKSVGLITFLVVLFMFSIGLSGVIQALIRLSQESASITLGLSTLAIFILGAFATILPAIFTAIIFTIVYYRIPDTPVQLRDAIFGAIIAIILFEIGKHIFFWANNLDTYRANVYGPITSVVVLMLWAFVASLIFLYGAAIARTASELRPK